MDRYLSNAKRVDNGEWVTGYYSICLELGDNGGVGAMYRETVSELHYIVDKYGKAELIDPTTLCQSTGVYDKEENLIFEKDMVDVLYNGYSDDRNSFVAGSTEGYVYFAEGVWMVAGSIDIALRACFSIERKGNKHD